MPDIAPLAHISDANESDILRQVVIVEPDHELAVMMNQDIPVIVKVAKSET